MKAKKTVLLAMVLFSTLFCSSIAFAHCDTPDGPVIIAAKKAIETGNVKLVLIWVGADHENEITNSFQKTLEVRKLGPTAMDLADNYFFETLVRIHRAGEGEPYTGIKPAGSGHTPAIVAADKAVETGSSDALKKLMGKKFTKEVEERFNSVIKAKNYNPEDVKAGREYVKAYVSFVHHVEESYNGENGEAHHKAEKHGHGK